jgi:hypothetical protein
LRCHLLRRSMSFCAMAEDIVSSSAEFTGSTVLGHLPR